MGLACIDFYLFRWGIAIVLETHVFGQLLGEVCELVHALQSGTGYVGCGNC
jgi:hypothetical protein